MFDCSTEKTQEGDSAYGRKNFGVMHDAGNRKEESD